MADNTQQNILLSVQIVDNFINAKKNVDQWQKALNDAQKVGTIKQSAQHFVQAAVDAAGDTTLRFAAELMKRTIDRYAVRNGIK